MDIQLGVVCIEMKFYIWMKSEDFTSSSLTGSKPLISGGAKVGASVAEPKVRNVSQILLILSQKNEANLSVRL